MTNPEPEEEHINSIHSLPEQDEEKNDDIEKNKSSL